MHAYALAGNSAIVISVPHDGHLRPADETIPHPKARRDLHTSPLAMACGQALERLTGKRPAIIVSRLHRSYIDMNRPPYQGEIGDISRETYHDFHNFLDHEITLSLQRYQRCVLIDLHGYRTSPGPDTYDFVLDASSVTHSFGAAFKAALGNQHHVVSSPDKERGVNGSFSGGWIVTRTRQRWAQLGLEAIQLECNEHLRRTSTLTQTATILATAIAISYA